MKTKWILAAGVALLGLAATVQATPITGTVQMAGQVTFNSQNLATATTASFSNPAGVVTSGTGSYTGVSAFTPVAFTGFSFAADGPEIVNNLWSFTSGGLTYSFNLASITSVVASTDDLTIKGTGSVDITGFDETLASWSFAVTDTSGGNSGSYTFGFSQSNTAVPDGGTTVMLLGASLSGLALLKRKLAA